MDEPRAPTVVELMTEPDVVEAAEKLAEQLRSSLYENEELEELAESILPSYIVNPEGDWNAEEATDAYAEGQRAMTLAIIRLLKPMIVRVLDEGDWRLPEPGEEGPISTPAPPQARAPELHLDPNVNKTTPQPGMYEVTYRQQSGNYRWYDWIMTAKFLSKSYRQPEPEYDFSLRPLAGTTSLPVKDIIRIERMPDQAKPRLPYRIGPTAPRHIPERRS